MFHRTERLFLRPAWPEDWKEVLGGIADEGVVRNLARAPWPYQPEHARAFAATPQDPRQPRFLIVLPGTHGASVIGCIGLDDHHGDGEIGYWIARPWWGRGFATEAGRGMLEVARLLGHRRLAAGHFVDNPASGRVLRKIGFRPTGVIAERKCLGRGCKVPTIEYVLDLEEDVGEPPQMRAA